MNNLIQKEVFIDSYMGTRLRLQAIKESNSIYNQSASRFDVMKELRTVKGVTMDILQLWQDFQDIVVRDGEFYAGMAWESAQVQGRWKDYQDWVMHGRPHTFDGHSRLGDNPLDYHIAVSARLLEGVQ